MGIFGWGTESRDKGNEGEEGRNRENWFPTQSTMSPCQAQESGIRRGETQSREESMKGQQGRQE